MRQSFSIIACWLFGLLPSTLSILLLVSEQYVVFYLYVLPFDACVQALLADIGDMTEIVVNGTLRIYQWQLGCPIRLERDYLIRGTAQSHPPLDLINFRFSFGCLQLSRSNFITFRDILFNNTMFDSPITPIVHHNVFRRVFIGCCFVGGRMASTCSFDRS